MKHILLICTIAFALPALALDWNNPDEVVRAAIDANPSLRGLTAQLTAARSRVAPAGSLPNPMLMGGVQNKPIDLSQDFMTMYMIGASQTIVPGARRDALRRAAQLDVERLQREYESERAEIERDVRLAYDQAAAAQNQIATNEEIARLVQMIVDAARIRYETGMAPQADMIRSMLEASNVRRQINTLRRERSAAVAQILALLNLALTTDVPAFSLQHELQRHREHPMDTSLPASTSAIAALQTDVARAEQNLRLARLARRPDINIEASYGARQAERDMFSVVGRVELPIRRSSLIEPRIREAIAQREAAQQEIAALQQRLVAALGDAVARRTEAIEQIDLYVDRLVPEARLGFQSALTSYQTGKTTFDAVLSSLQTLRALNVDYYQFLRQQLDAEIDIEAIRRGARSGASGGAMALSPAMPSSRPPAGTSMQVMR